MEQRTNQPPANFNLLTNKTTLLHPAPIPHLILTNPSRMFPSLTNPNLPNESSSLNLIIKIIDYYWAKTIAGGLTTVLGGELVF